MLIEGDAARFYAGLHNRRPAVFLDFDGVLAPIAPTPDAVVVEEPTRAAVRRLLGLTDGALAVISGRGLDEIDRHLGVSVPVAGDHGNTRRRSDGRIERLTEQAPEAAAQLASRVRQQTEGDARLIVEQKSTGVALHYRQAPERAADCDAIMVRAVAADANWSLIRGKMVVEARPAGVDKGSALKAFMAEHPYAGRVPLMIGDDTTDEDAFIMAQQLQGFGIKVGAGETSAVMRLAGQGEVLPLLLELALILEGNG